MFVIFLGGLVISFTGGHSSVLLIEFLAENSIFGK